MKGSVCANFLGCTPWRLWLLEAGPWVLQKSSRIHCLANVFDMREIAVSKSQGGFLRDDFWEHRGVSIGQAHMRLESDIEVNRTGGQG